MIANKTLIVAFFPKDVPAEICLHEMIKMQSHLCSRECALAPIATTKNISQQFPDQEIIILNDGNYLSVFRTAEEVARLIQRRWFNKIAIVSCDYKAKRLKRDLKWLFNGRINVYESIPQAQLRDFYLKNLNWKKSWATLWCWTREGIKKMLPWPVYTFLASRA